MLALTTFKHPLKVSNFWSCGLIMQNCRREIKDTSKLLWDWKYLPQKSFELQSCPIYISTVFQNKENYMSPDILKIIILKERPILRCVHILDQSAYPGHAQSGAHIIIITCQRVFISSAQNSTNEPQLPQVMIVCQKLGSFIWNLHQMQPSSQH